MDFLRQVVLLVCLLLPCFLQAQYPSNDSCHQATLLPPNDTLRNLSNQGASTNSPDSPQTAPGTCIPGLHNDVWFEFISQSDTDFYEIGILVRECQSDYDGLQMLLIESPDCNPAHYNYLDCVNGSSDTVWFYLHPPSTGIRYLLYLDGYGGDICSFDLLLKTKGRLLPRDYLRLRKDMVCQDSLTTDFPELRTTSLNNRVEISWQGGTSENIALYLVEKFDLVDGEIDSCSNVILKHFPVQNYTGSGNRDYLFQDNWTTFRPGEEHIYRLIGIRPDGERLVSEYLRIAPVVEKLSLEITQVLKGAEGQYGVWYTNYKKRQKVHVEVLNETEEVVKSADILLDQPEGVLYIEMQDFPPGNYLFTAQNDAARFRYPFTVD